MAKETTDMKPVQNSGMPFAIPLTSLIIDWEWNSRSFDNLDVPEIGATSWQSMDELTRSIKEYGQRDPIEVVPDGEKFRVIAGFRRCEALKRLNSNTAIVQIFRTKRPEDADIWNLAENMGRNALRPYEIARKCFKIKKTYDLSGEAIAARVGNLSKSYVNNLIRAQENLVPDVMEAWIDPKHPAHKLCTTDNLNALAKINDKREQLKAWEDLCGIADATDAENEGLDNNDRSAKKQAPKARKRADMLAMIKACKAGEMTGDKKVINSVIAALEWAAGNRKEIVGLRMVKT